jgi:branched-chain amino acid transport system substrate-binding protein
VRLSRRPPASLAVLTLLVTALTGCSSESAGKTDVIIGADLSPTSDADLAYTRGLQLRVEQINASGQLGDRQLVIRFMDNRQDPTASLRDITAFADDPSVAAVITGACNSCIVGATKTLNDKHLPTVALASADQVSSPVDTHRYVFKIGPNSADTAAAMAGELQSDRIGKVAILYTDDLYGKGAYAALIAELAKARIATIGKITVKPTATDISQAVGTLTDSRPDALVVLTPADLSLLAATSARQAHYTGRLYFDAAAGGDLFIPREAAAATDGATMIFAQTMAIDDVIATNPAKSARKQWFSDYTARYGSYSGVAAFAADAADLIAAGVAREGGDRPALRSTLENAQFTGLSGPIRMSADNHSGLTPDALTVLVATGGRWRAQN